MTTEPPRSEVEALYGDEYLDWSESEDDALRHDREYQAAWLAKEAVKAHERGEHTRAAELYLDAIPYDPEAPTLRLGLGREAFEIGECDIAYVALLDFLELWWPHELSLDLYWRADSAESEGHRLLAELEASGCVSESLLRTPACASGTPWLLD